jgi:hypothetical protein
MLNQSFPKLNFPDYTFRIKKNETGTLMIFDTIRKKFIVLTPEEWVRQHLINYLIQDKKYPNSLFAVEKGLRLNSTQKRTDIRIYNNQKQLLLLAECKSFTNNITQKTLEQVLRYELSLQSQLIVLSNGLMHYCFQKNNEGKFNALQTLPEYSTLI